MMSTVLGLFERREQIPKAIEALRDAGVEQGEVSLIMRDRREAEGLADDVGVESDNATAVGALGGGILGGVAGVLVGAGLLVIPGLGPIVAAGPLAAVIAGAAGGATAGGLLGTLVDWGVAESEARRYHEGVERGGILLAVRVPDDDAATVRAALAGAGAKAPA